MPEMDKLDRVFELQAALNDEITRLRGLEDISADEWLQRLTLAMLSELSETLDGTNFKWWKNPRELDMNYIREELVDIFHFFVSMCLRSGMDADELFKRYLAKHQENLDRQHGLSQKEGYDVSKLI